MGYSESARIHLAEARDGLNNMPNIVLQIAGVEASLGVMQAVEDLTAQVAELSHLMKRAESLDRPEDAPPLQFGM